MEIQHVREFLSLAETESYFETAEQLFITTSSLSRHIKALESEMGVTLFDRTTRKVTLNRYGKLFLPFAKEFARIDDECTRAFTADQHEQTSRITIGSIPMMRAYRITDLLAEYQHGNKTTELNVMEGDPFKLLPQLREGEIDFAFIRDQGVTPEDFEKITFTEDHLCVVVPFSHPLAKRKSVTIADLQEEPLLMIGKDAFMYKLCIDLCKQEGFDPNVRFTSHRAENLIDAVARGMGLALLMRRPAALLINEQCRLIDIIPEVKTIISLVWLKSRKLPTHHRKFIELVKGIDC